MKKAQLFSGEFFIAFFIFMIVLTMALFLWYTTIWEVTKAENFYDMEETAIDAIEQLVRTQGHPLDWGVENVTNVGLANGSRFLDGDKVLTFVDMMNVSKNDLCNTGSNYQCYRYLLGTGKFDFYFNVTYLNGTTYILGGTEIFAGEVQVDKLQRITIVRTGILDNETVRIKLTVWGK